MSRPGLATLIKKNIGRRPIRNGILVVCVAAVVGMQLAAALIERAGKHGLELGIKRLGADLVAVPRGLQEEMEHSYMTGEAALFYMDGAIEEKIAACDFVEKTSAQVYIKSLSGASCCSAWNIFLIGFEPGTDFTVRPWLTENMERKIGDDEIIVGAAFIGEPGDKLKFYGQEFTIAGKLDPTGAGLDMTAFIPMDAAYRMARESSTRAEKSLELTEGTISAVLIGLRPEEEGGLPVYRAAYELEEEFPDLTFIQPDDLLLKVEKNISGALGTMRSAGYAIWPVTALLIGLVFAMAAGERRREIGLLRAMGATRWFVFRMVMLEALLVSALGAAAGMALSLGLLAGFSRLIALSLEVPFHWPGMGELMLLLALAVVLALLTAAAAAALPSFQAGRMEPYEAIRRAE